MNTIAKRGPLIFAALLTGCLIAACGSSKSTTTTTTSAAASSAAGGGRFATFRNCLKQHGINLPARRPGNRPPGGAGGTPGAGGTLGAGGRPGAGGPPGGGFFGGGGPANNPKLAAAVKTCGGGNFRGGRRFRLSRTAITNYVTCVRPHGYNLPEPAFSGRGPVFPSSIRSNPKFQAASKACQNLLVRPRPGTSTTTASRA